MAVPDVFSINVVTVALEGAEVAVVSTDCRVTSATTGKALVTYLITTIPEPPSPVL